MINRRHMQSWSTINTLILILALTSVSLAAQVLPLGTAHLVAKPTACDSETCYLLDVDCEQILDTGRVTLKVGDHDGRRYRGTILFTTGGQGTRRWQDLGKPAARTISRLQKRGFRTVQIVWERGWMMGAPGAWEGQANLACRPATVAEWVRVHFHIPEKRGAFCGTGNSAGAAQISYMLTRYGMADHFAAVVLTGGPPLTRIDQACLVDPSTRFSSRRNIDRGFGFYHRDGPCMTHDQDAADVLQAASILGGRGEFDYPDTLVWFLFGERDLSNAVPQGLKFYDRLVAAGQDLLGISLVPKTGHATPKTKRGSRAVFDLLTAACR